MSVKGKKTQKKVQKKQQTPSTTNLSPIPMITDSEWLEREEKYVQRLQDIKTCVGFIQEAQAEYRQLQAEDAEREYWQHYLSCSGLPMPADPPEIRTFIAGIQHADQLMYESMTNWLLAVDECSILTQNYMQADLTRNTLRRTLRPNVGQHCENNLSRITAALLSIKRLLINEIEMSKLSQIRSVEIVNAYDDLHKEAERQIDQLAYCVVSSNGAFMHTTDNIEATYCYKCSSYDLDIWTLRDISIRFKQLEIPMMVAVLECTSVQVQIPLSVLSDNLTLLSVHSFIDPFTEHAKSYEPLIGEKAAELNAGIVDLEECLINEWHMQIDIQTEMRAMEIERLRQLEEQLEQEKLAMSDKPKPKKKDDTERVVLFPEGMWPDPEKRFLEHEQSEYIEMLTEFFDPAKLDLYPYEINLRKHIIVGGIYSMLFVRKPPHKAFEKFNITLNEDGRKLYTLYDVVATIEQKTTQKLAKKNSISQLPIDTQGRTEPVTPWPLHLADGELPYFFVTIELPEYLCLWGEPIACQFLEEEEEEKVLEELPVDTETEKKKKLRKSNLRKKNRIKVETKPVLSQEIINSEPRTPIITQPVIRFNSRIERSNKNIPNAFHSSKMSIIRSSMFMHIPVENPVNVRNCRIDGRELQLPTVRDLQRHCVPRILSSFQFPIDFREDFENLAAEKQQQAPVATVKLHYTTAKKVEEPVEAVPEFCTFFGFENQDAPERVYPIFDAVEQVRILNPETSITFKLITISNSSDSSELSDSIDQGDTDSPVKTIGQFINTLDTIQEKYINRHKNITEQPPFISKVKAPKTRNVLDLPVTPSKDTHANLRRKNSMTAQRKSKPGLAASSSSHFGTHEIVRTVSPTSLDIEVRRSIQQESNTEVGPSDESLFREKRPNVAHWTTNYIREAKFDRNKRTITIKTDRLGRFGFAFKRYEQFPFRHWSVQTNQENSKEIIFKLDTFHVRILLYISNTGIHGYVSDLHKEYVAKPKKYLVIDEPISDYEALKTVFRSKNINIFAEHDACFYIENGYFSVKHLSTELNVYDAIAVHCNLLNFYSSEWNRLATRRNMVLCMHIPKDSTESSVFTVRVTPECSTFVDIKELCSDDLDVFNLEYAPTWRNIGTYSDLHHIINSLLPQATDLRNREPRLIYYIRKLLTEIRPLSYS